MAWGLPVELAQGGSSRSTGALQKYVIPAKAGIQRGGARAVHAESHHRDIAPNGCAKNPVRVICTTSQTTDSRLDHVRHPVAPPLWIPAFAGMTDVCKDLE